MFLVLLFTKSRFMIFPLISYGVDKDVWKPYNIVI